MKIHIDFGNYHKRKMALSSLYSIENIVMFGEYNDACEIARAMLEKGDYILKNSN
ncbi:MAG: hypothetical protein GY756_13145 [bacterium]|nr:hypothetical protein [bacterium]